MIFAASLWNAQTALELAQTKIDYRPTQIHEVNGAARMVLIPGLRESPIEVR